VEASDRKDMLPTYQAYDLAIAGIEPKDVPIRQVDFEETQVCVNCGGIDKSTHICPDTIRWMQDDKARYGYAKE